MLSSDIFEYIQELNSLDKHTIVLEMREIIKYLKKNKTLSMKIIPDKIKEATLIYCDGNIDEAFEELVELINYFNSNPKKYLIDMEILLDDYCTYEDLCPECGQELTYDTWQEERADGLYELMNEQVCINACRS